MGTVALVLVHGITVTGKNKVVVGRTIEIRTTATIISSPYLSVVSSRKCKQWKIHGS
jgi:hypothetical protein